MRKINIIILASGNSLRFGSNKLLYKFNTIPLVELTIEKAILLKKELNNIISNIFVVSKYDEVLEIAVKHSIKYVFNENSNEGISSSIKKGILSCNSESFMFMVSDMPYLKYSTLKELILEFIYNNYKIVSLGNDKYYGNPSILDNSYKNELLELNEDFGAKKVIRKHMDELFVKKVSDLELQDIDYL